MSKIDMFLALEGSRQGSLRGESQVEGHVGEIELKGWSWGMSQQVNATAQASSKATVRAITFTKDIDSASTALMSALKSAEVLSKVVLTCRDAGGPTPIDYLRITLKKARVSQYELGSNGSVEGRQVTESFALAFKEIEVVYTPKAAANARAGACTYVDVYE